MRFQEIHQHRRFQVDKIRQPIIAKIAWGVYLLMAALICISCSSEKPTYIEPHLKTLTATDITRTQATLNGVVDIEGDADIPKLIFRYGTTENMDQTTQPIEGTQLIVKPTTNGQEASVSLPLSNLIAGTTYYYRLQGSNERTTINANTMTFATQPNEKPTLGKAEILSHGPMSVIIGYEITDDGGESITETGCYYSLTTSIDKEQKVTMPHYQDGICQQKVLLDNLKRNTTYQIWPYARSRAGETIGEALTFTTSDAISLHEAGELQTLLGDALYDYTSLTLAGEMNGDDLSCLRKMMGRDADGTITPGKLSVIDMTDVKIVAGGGPYGSSRYTQDHVIGQGLFADCTQLQEVSLPKDAITLEKDAFMGCTALTKIEIPASINSILPSSGCTALESISLSGANSHYQSKDGVLLNGDATAILWFPMGKKGEYTLPSSITSIGKYAFKECSIETFILPDNLTTIGQGAFMDSKVKEVRLPNLLKTVPSNTFQGCKQLKVVHLGSKTELLSDYVFDQCPLTDLYVSAPLPPVCSTHTFTTYGTNFLSTCKLHVPAGKVGFYKSSDGWKLFKNITTE